MEAQIVEREMTDEERKFLTDLLKSSPSSFRRWMQGVQNALVLWAASLLGLILIWLCLAWLVHLVVNLDIGIKSQYAIWVASFSAPLCALYAIYASVKWVRAWPGHRKTLRQDIDGSKVIDERFKVIEVKRFQELEHGGLIYFLRMDDNRVLVLYDHDSIELAMDGKDALASAFKPCRELHIIRAPNTEYVLEQQFSGDRVALSPPIDLTVSPDQWPEQESWCDIPWCELESKLSA